MPSPPPPHLTHFPVPILPGLPFSGEFLWTSLNSSHHFIKSMPCIGFSLCYQTLRSNLMTMMPNSGPGVLWILYADGGWWYVRDHYATSSFILKSIRKPFKNKSKLLHHPGEGHKSYIFITSKDHEKMSSNISKVTNDLYEWIAIWAPFTWADIFLQRGLFIGVSLTIFNKNKSRSFRL